MHVLSRMRDADVRIAVRKLLHSEHQHDADTRVVEEMGIWSGAVRVDMAVINGELAGYEIKSARDTLSRLPTQAALYSEVFDRVHLVAAGKHITHAADTVPTWWGIVAATASDGDASIVELEVIRPGSANPAVDPLQLARLLWRDEAVAILERHGVARGIRSATKATLAAKLAQEVSLDELRREVRRCLKDRQQWLGQPAGNQRDVPVSGEAGPLSAAS